mgnify:FL=1
MNSLLLLIIGVPLVEILIMIKIGHQIGGINTVILIFLTAVIGLYIAKMQGLQTMRMGFTNIYNNKSPVYELISGASIALAAILLIIPGFLTDFIGFILLIPWTRKILLKIFFKNKIINTKQSKTTDILDGEIVDNKKEDDEL